MNLKFGRLSSTLKIKAINKDCQYLDGAPNYIRESKARNDFQKWNNTKHIKENFTERSRAREILNQENPRWGISVTTAERHKEKYGEGIHFGIVITLKEINGKNRIDDFIQQAELRGWIVNPIKIENQLDIYNKLEEDINLD